MKRKLRFVVAETRTPRAVLRCAAQRTKQPQCRYKRSGGASMVAVGQELRAGIVRRHPEHRQGSQWSQTRSFTDSTPIEQVMNIRCFRPVGVSDHTSAVRATIQSRQWDGLDATV